MFFFRFSRNNFPPVFTSRFHFPLFFLSPHLIQTFFLCWFCPTFTSTLLFVFAGGRSGTPMIIKKSPILKINNMDSPPAESPTPEQRPRFFKWMLPAPFPRPPSPSRSESQVVFYHHGTPPPLVLARPPWALEPELFASPVVVPPEAHAKSRSHVSATPSSQLDDTSPPPQAPQWNGVWTLDKWKKENL